jgi:outer membrane murein-binding lipoprotein Lpp
MLRIFLILALAVSLAGVAFSFVLRDKVGALSTQRDNLIGERDQAVQDATQAKANEKKARDAEKAAKADLETTQQELTATTTRLNEATGQLEQRSRELEETKVVRDTAQRELAAWKATGIQPNQINSLKAEAARLQTERDAFAEEKKVMGREIARLNEELDVYRGRTAEIVMPDVKGRITSVDAKYQYVVLDKGAEDGLRPNGKMIITRGENLVGKVQLVRVEPRSAVANLLANWTRAEVQAGDQVMTSYEALAK